MRTYVCIPKFGFEQSIVTNSAVLHDKFVNQCVLLAQPQPKMMDHLISIYFLIQGSTIFSPFLGSWIRENLVIVLAILQCIVIHFSQA